MFKSIIAAAVIATATFSTQANALTIPQCVTMGESVQDLALLRDQGVTPEAVYTSLTNSGIPEGIILKMLEVVYVQGSALSGPVLNKVFVQNCVGESA